MLGTDDGIDESVLTGTGADVVEVGRAAATAAAVPPVLDAIGPGALLLGRSEDDSPSAAPMARGKTR